MTSEQQNILIALGSVRCLPATFDKRFTRNLSAAAKNNTAYELSESQIKIMYSLLYKYRKQLPATYEKYKNHPDCKPKIK